MTAAAKPNLPSMPDMLTEHQRVLLVTRAIEEVRAGHHRGPKLAALRISPQLFEDACWAFVSCGWSAERVGAEFGIIKPPSRGAKKKAGARGRKGKRTPAPTAADKTAMRNLERALSTVRAKYLELYRDEVSRLAGEAKHLTLVGEPAELARHAASMLSARLAGALSDQESFDALDRHEKHVLLRGVHLLMESPRLAAHAELRTAQAEKITKAIDNLAGKFAAKNGGTLTRKDVVDSFVEAGFGQDIAEALSKRKGGDA